jgi:hypothetical protein
MLASLNQARGLLFDAPETPAAAPETPPDCDILTSAGQNVPDAPPAAPPAPEKP